jgi:adenylylsulfate kinase-like enzyme
MHRIDLTVILGGSIRENFREVFISTPLEHCIQNDTSGLYQKARKGKIKNLPGVDVKYEIPLNGTLNIDYSKMDKETAAQMILKSLNDEPVVKRTKY